MNQLDALVVILEATIELDDQPHIRKARKVLTKMADHRREVRERRFPKPQDQLPKLPKYLETDINDD